MAIFAVRTTEATGKPAMPRSYTNISRGQPRTRAALLQRKPDVGILANMQAELITRFKDITPEGGVIELVVWRVPQPVPPTAHGFKYRAVYAVGGMRVLGFDNERGKGDHCHIGGLERPYTFTTVDRLIEDFIAAVTAFRRKS